MTQRYFERDIAQTIADALDEMPVVVITGMRQTGKSTFLLNQPEIKHRRYLSLDDFAVLEAARADPAGFVSSEEPLTIDEVQRCPELLNAIKREVDRNRSPGRFLLSGSANLALLRSVSETLAGRAVYFVMYPFTRRERLKLTPHRPFIQEFFEAEAQISIPSGKPIDDREILLGGLPPVCLEQIKDKDLWFKGFEQTYLERDIRDLSQIGNIISFRHLLHLVALRTGQILSISQLGRDAKMNVATTTRYLSLLEASFVISRLNAYLGNRASRLIKSPKVFINDSGLACYLAGIKGFRTDDVFKGAMFETYVVQTLSGIIEATWQGARLYFWSIQGRYEVDFVIEADNKCIAIEVKASPQWQVKDFSGLRAFLSRTPHCIAGIIAYNGEESIKLGNRLWAIPLSVLLS
jgi:hypothetical protein